LLKKSENFLLQDKARPVAVPDHKNFQKNLRPDFSVQQSAESDGNLHQVVELERKAGREKMGQIPENFCGRVLAFLIGGGETRSELLIGNFLS
jgi:hypothetical protein